MRKHLIATSVAALFNSAASYALPEIDSVQPDFVKMRHSAEVHVKVKDFDPSLELGIIPGGIYIEQQQTLPKGKHKLFLTDTHPGLVTNTKTDIFSRTILLDEFKLIAADDKQLAISTGGKLEIYSDLHKTREYDFPQPISQLDINENSACILLENSQLLIGNIRTGDFSEIKLQQAITAISSIENYCITANKKNEIQLWQESDNSLIEVAKTTLNSRIHKIITYQNLLLIANGATGLTVLEIDKNSRLRWKSSYNKLGNVITIANDATDVLVADDEGILTLIDITGANRPLLISDFFLGQVPETLSYSNGKAYALSNNTVTTINFESQTSPMISTQGVNQGGSRRSFIDQDILYVADWFSGLHLYDISQPHNPKLISSYHTPGSPKGVLVRNDIAYVADDDHGLQILNVSNPRRPQLLSNLPLEGLAYTMKLRRNTLFLASHYGGFHIIDVSIANQPKLIGSVNTPGKPWALALKNDELFVADDQNGLLVFDISNPQSPELTTQFNPGGFAEDIIIRGNRAYLAFFDLGLFILDISNSRNIKVLSTLKTPGSARGLELINNRLYLASWEAGVTVIDISNELQPQLLSQFDTDGASWGLSVKDKVIYAMDWWGGVKIIDANNEARLREIARYQTAGIINDISLHKNFLYAAHGARGLQIYEASNTLNPVWASGVDIIGNALAVAVNDNVALVASEDNGLNIINIANSFQPQWQGKINLREKIVDVAIKDQLAVALADNGNVFVIDISNPEFPEFQSLLPINASQILFEANVLWCLSRTSDIIKFEIQATNKLAPTGQFQLPQAATRFFVRDNIIYVAHTNQQLAKYVVQENKLHLQSQLGLGNEILDISVRQNLLYVTTENRTLNAIKDEQHMQLMAQYPSTHRIEKIAVASDGVFFSGESRIASGKLLPELSIQKTTDGFKVLVPKDMPLGNYHMSVINQDGRQQTRLNSLEIGFPKFKPKFTMEDLKRKMQEQNLSGEALQTE